MWSSYWEVKRGTRDEKVWETLLINLLWEKKSCIPIVYVDSDITTHFYIRILRIIYRNYDSLKWHIIFVAKLYDV